MRINKTYTISEKNIENLKKVKNASALIDTLLNDYFIAETFQTEEEIEKRLKILDIEERTKKEIEEIQHG